MFGRFRNWTLILIFYAYQLWLYTWFAFLNIFIWSIYFLQNHFYSW
jgi:hypothetical protein